MAFQSFFHEYREDAGVSESRPRTRDDAASQAGIEGRVIAADNLAWSLNVRGELARSFVRSPSALIRE